MIDINKLDKARNNNGEFEVWGFEKSPSCKKGLIDFNAITYPVLVQSISFDIQCYYVDGFTFDDNIQTIIPVNREDLFKELLDDEIKRSYGANYYPVHEFYFIPKPYIIANNQKYYDKMIKDLELFEKIINDFFLTREEIISAVKYIEKFFYKEDYFLDESEWRDYKKYDLL